MECMVWLYDCRLLGPDMKIVDVYLDLYDFIFESVYLGDGFRLAVMLPKFLRTWSGYELDVCLYIYMDDFSGEYVTL